MNLAVPLPLSQSHKETLCGSGWLSTRSAAFQDGLLSIGSMITCAPGYVLHRNGVAPTHVHCLVEGEIHFMRTGPENEEISYPVTTPARWMAIAEVTCAVPTISTATIQRQSRLFRISRTRLLAFLGDDPSRYRDVLEYEIQHRRRVQRANELFKTAVDGDQAVARSLLYMIDVEQIHVGAEVSFSRAAWATSIGLSMPTVQRAFHRMKKLGILETRYGAFVVTDRAKLQAFAERITE